MISAALLALTGILAAPSPGIEVLKIAIDDECRVERIKPTTVKRKDRDILVWRIQNECLTPRSVLICVTPAPPLTCLGDPEDAKLATAFEIGGANTAADTHYIVCTVRWPATRQGFEIEVATGEAGKTVACVPHLPESHELALEVVP